MIVVSDGLSAIKTDSQYRYFTKMIQDAFPTTNPSPILLSMVSMKQYFYVYRGKPISVVSLRSKGRLRCGNKTKSNILYNVATHPLYQHRGYMKKLLTHVINTSRREGKRHLHLDVFHNNHPALSLYQSLGFVIVEQCGEVLWMRIDLRKKNQ